MLFGVEGGRFSCVPEWVCCHGGRLSANAVNLYAILMMYANSVSLQAWPSQETLARRMGCSVRLVSKVVKELKDAGCLAVTPRRNKTGRTSNIYELKTTCPWGDPGFNSEPDVSQDCEEPAEPSIPQDTLPGLPPSPEPKPEELKAPKAQADAGTEQALKDDFEELWAQNPLKKGKKAAWKSYREARKYVEAATIYQAYRAQWQKFMSEHKPGEERFFPHLSTWLNGARWEDEIEPAVPPEEQAFLDRQAREEAIRRAGGITFSDVRY